MQLDTEGNKIPQSELPEQNWEKAGDLGKEELTKSLEHLRCAPDSWKAYFRALSPEDQKRVADKVEFSEKTISITTILKDQPVKIIVSRDLYIPNMEDKENHNIKVLNGKAYMSVQVARDIIPEDLQVTGPMIKAISEVLPNNNFQTGKYNKSAKMVFDLLGMEYAGCFMDVDGVSAHHQGGDKTNNDFKPINTDTGYLMTTSISKDTGGPYVLTANTEHDEGILQRLDPSILALMLILAEPVKAL